MGPLIIGADHAGFDLKEALKETLAAWGLTVEDVGTDGPAAVDYPDMAAAVAREVSAGRYPRGVLVCGSGVGMAIAANKFPRVRAALCLDETSARLSRQHNDANILVLAGRKTDADTARGILKAWLETGFEGGRHQRRLDKITAIEKETATQR